MTTTALQPGQRADIPDRFDGTRITQPLGHLIRSGKSISVRKLCFAQRFPIDVTTTLRQPLPYALPKKYGRYIPTLNDHSIDQS